MWYEILPPFVIMVAALTIPQYYSHFATRLVCGQPFKRKLYDERDVYLYLRDARLSHRKWAYDFNGLDNIPD